MYYTLCRLEFKQFELATLVIPKGLDPDYAFSYHHTIVDYEITDRTVEKFLVPCNEYKKNNRPLYPESANCQAILRSTYEDHEFVVEYF